MSIIVSSDLAAAIEARERSPLLRLAIDWDGDGFGPAGSIDDLTGKAGALSIDRSIITDLPPQVRLVEGSAAATASVGLAIGDPTDDSMHAARYFTRGSDSPIGGKERVNRPVTVDIGFITAAGPQWVRRLTGLTRRMLTKSAGTSASLDALDNRALVHNPVTLVPTDGTQNGADGTWIVTQALAANGIYAGPAPRASGSLLWVPMYGSLLPIGWPLGGTTMGATGLGFASLFTNLSIQTRPTFQAGPFALAASPYIHSATDWGRIAVSVSPAPAWDGMRGRLEMWVLGVPNPTVPPIASAGRHYLVYRRISQPGNIVRAGIDHNGHPFLKVTDFNDVTIHLYTGAATVSPDGAWHPVGVHFDNTAQTVTFRIDGGYETQSTTVVPSDIPTPIENIQIVGWTPISDVHLHDIAATEPWLADTITIGAVIDRSTLQLEASYEAAPRDPWELLGELAASEQAVAAFDEAGIFRYRTRARLVDVAGQTVQRVLTTDDVSLLDIEVPDGVDQIRNIIQVTYTPATVQAFGFVYTDQQHRVLPPQSTTDFQLSFGQPVVGGVQTTLTLQSVATFGLFTMSDSYFVATTHSDLTDDVGAIYTFSALLSAYVVTWTPSGALVRFTNSNTIPIYVAGIGLQGTAVTVGNPVVAEARDEDSIATYGPLLMQMTLPQWVQTAGVAQSLANAVLGDLKGPHPQVQAIRIVGDPRRQLGDRVRIEDPNGTRLAGEFWLTQIKDDVSEQGGYEQTIAARQATTVARYGSGHYGTETYG